jgi:hypothetical protein
MVSFLALPGRYQVMTPRCWPGTCWKATGTSPVTAVAPSDGRCGQRTNPSREPCGRKLSKRVLTAAGTATRPLFYFIYLFYRPMTISVPVIPASR